MAQKPETAFRKKLRLKLERLPNSFWESIQQVAIIGTPDIIGTIGGVFVAIEVKAEGGRSTPMQIYKREMIKKAGGIALEVFPHNEIECLNFLEKIVAQCSTNTQIISKKRKQK